MPTAEGEMMTISKAAREACLSIYTLRYYECAESIELERTRVVEAPDSVTHLRFRIRR